MRNWCETEPISASRSASVSARRVASLMACAKIEMLQRGRGVAQNGIDALPDGSRPLARLLPRSIAKTPKSPAFPANGANEPAGGLRRSSTTAPLRLSLRPRAIASVSRLTAFRHPLLAGECRDRGRLAVRSRTGSCDWPMIEAEVLADGGVDVACGVGSGEPARESVKVLHFGFAAAREIGLSLRLVARWPVTIATKTKSGSSIRCCGSCTRKL